MDFFDLFDPQAIQEIPETWFWGIVGACLFSAFYFLYRSFKALIKARILQDTPTAKIRSTHQGYTELSGRQLNLKGQALNAPLSHETCTWYKYSVERYSQKRWNIIETGHSSDLFLLDDGTGVCFIDPKGADVTTPHSKVWRGFHRIPKGYPKGWFAKLFGTMGPYRYREWTMETQMPLYAIGNFRTLTFEQISDHSLHPQIKAVFETWQHEHPKASHESENSNTLKKNPTLNPIVNLMSHHQIPKRRPYVLSGYGFKRVVRRYKFDAFIWFLAYLLLGIFSAWLWVSRLEF